LELVVDGAVVGIEKPALRDDDDITGRLRYAAAENLANPAFRQVPLNGIPELPGGGDPKPTRVEIGGQDEHGEQAAVDLAPVLVNAQELRPPPDVLPGSETLGHGLPGSQRR
jgi:hypothetical protein